MTKLDATITQFERAYKRFEEVLAVPKTDIVPKDCFREAYRQGLLSYDDAWVKLVDLRNETAHTYNEETAERIYKELPDALKHFAVLLAATKGK
ncbi:MAG: nucleotidyltransferase substrate binding protein [Ignavibacteriales bacterium]|nr:nucleotidyltransferase substrate binding protein [Ignavibacteriales bacterium]